MAGRSTGQRFRSKTSDLSEFLRGSSHGSRPQDAIPPPLPSAPSSEGHRNKRRLHFLSRKKKSGLPVSAAATPPVPPSKNASPSAHQEYKRDPNRRKGPGIPSAIWNEDEEYFGDEQHGGAIPSRLPPVNVSPPSFHSVTEQFTPSSRNAAHSSNPAGTVDLRSQHSIASPRNSESSKDGTQTPTPRTPHPTIAISPPRATPLARAGEISRCPPTGTSSPDSSETGRANEPPSPDPKRLSVPGDVYQSNVSTLSLRGSVDTDRRTSSTISLDWRSETESEVSMTRTRTNSGGATSLMSSTSDTSAASLVQRRSVRQIPSPLRSKAPTAPPNIPLPTPPLSAASDGAIPAAYSSTSFPSIPSIVSQQHLPSGRERGSPRPRAVTTCSLPAKMVKSAGSPRSAAFPSTPNSNASPHHTKTPTKKHIGDENIDIDGTAHDQLRRAVTSQRSKIDDLSEYLLEIIGKHEAEKALLEHRIESLENEARKRDREIRGLRYLLMNGGVPGTTEPQRAATRSPGADTIEGLQLLEQMTPTRGSKSSTPASTPASKTQRRSATLYIPPPMRSPSRASSARSPTESVMGLGFDSMPQIPNCPSETSLASVSSTSTSSLPRLTAGNTASSDLSAIPESPTPYADPDSLDAAEKEEMRSSRVSVDSATSAYAANLRRGKTRSFGQVMESEPALGELVEKLKVLAD